MKFTAGYWTIRPGVTPHFAVQVHDVETDPEGVTVYALTRRIDTRGDTLNHPLLTIRLTSPLPNVVRVQIVHHKGRRPRAPHFELFTQSPPITVHDDAEAASLTSGDLTVRVAKGTQLAHGLHGRRKAHHRQRMARHGLRRHARRALRPRTVEHGRGRMCLRPRRAFYALCQKRAGRRSVERGRRHQQRTGLQKRPVLYDQSRLRRICQPPGTGLVRGRLGKGGAGAVQRAR